MIDCGDDDWLLTVVERQNALPESQEEIAARERAEYRHMEMRLYPESYEDRSPPDEAPKAMLAAARRWRSEVARRWANHEPGTQSQQRLAALLLTWRKRHGLRAEVVQMALDEYFAADRASDGSLPILTTLNDDIDQLGPSVINGYSRPWEVGAFIDYLRANHRRILSRASGDSVSSTDAHLQQYGDQLSREYWERGVGYIRRSRPEAGHA